MGDEGGEAKRYGALYRWEGLDQRYVTINYYYKKI